MSAAAGTRRRLAGEVQALREAYNEHDVLTYASAISFQVLFALVPLALFALGLLGGLQLQEVWRDELAPDVRENVSGPAYDVIDDTVDHVLADRQGLWITFGGLFAAWQVSGAVRATMGAVNRIYGIGEQRSFLRRLAVSLALSIAVTAMLLAAFGTARVLPLIVREGAAGTLVTVGRWPVAAALLLGAVALLVRFAPDERRPWRWVSLGTGLAVTAWVAASLLFNWYLVSIAQYGTIFGALATAIVVMTYLYVATFAFLTGLLLDSRARDVSRRA